MEIEKKIYMYRYMSLKQNDGKDRMIIVIQEKPKRNAIHILYRNDVFIIYSCMYSTAKKQCFVEENKGVLSLLSFCFNDLYL